MNQQEKQKTLQKLYDMTFVPKEWVEFNGDYKKCMQDIRLKDGTEIEECWPNAGKFNVFSIKHKPIPISEVTHVKAHKGW